MNIIKQSTTTYKIGFFMVDSTDHITGKTGRTVSVAVEKNGAASVSGTGSVAEGSNGNYWYTPSASDVNTLGEVMFYFSATGADPINKPYTVVPFDPYDTYRGFTGTAIPQKTFGLAGGLMDNVALDSVAHVSAFVSASTTNYVFTTSGSVPSNLAVSGACKGMRFNVTAGKGIGQSRIVTNSSTSIGNLTLTFDAAFSEALDATTVWHLTRDRLPSMNSSLQATIDASGVWSYATRTLSAVQSTNTSYQQYSNIPIIKGNAYSSTARTLVWQVGTAEWPTDLSLWTWTLYSRRHKSNGAPGADTITGTVTVETATGSSRALRLSITAANSALLATGLYEYALRGTKSSEPWDAVKGIVTVSE